jgi:hypothetical protein
MVSQNSIPDWLVGLHYQKRSGTRQTKFEPVAPFPSGRLLDETPGLIFELGEIIFKLREDRRVAKEEEKERWEKNTSHSESFHRCCLKLST